MNRILFRLGHGAAARPWRTIAVWVAVVVAAFGLAGAFGGTTHDDYDIPDVADSLNCLVQTVQRAEVMNQSPAWN